MSSFYSRRRNVGARGGFMRSSGWSQQQQQQPMYSSPFDFISNLVSPVLDIMNPLEDIKDLMNQGLSWYQRTPMQQLIPKQLQRKTVSKVTGGQRLPQKYRIVIDCTGFEPKSLRTHIKCVQDNKHLIVSSDVNKSSRGGVFFKRSYTLPQEVDAKKMTKFVSPSQQQLVIEFNYVDTAIPLVGITAKPKICQMPEGRCVHVVVPIADFIDPVKVQLHVRGRDLIVRCEERVIPFGDSCSRVLYHNRIPLPQNVNVSAIKAKCDKHKLTILAPVIETKKVTGAGGISQKLQNIPVQHKMRHRKAKSVSGGAQKEQEQVIPEKSLQQQKQKKQKMPLETTTKTTAEIEKKKKKSPITEPAISEKKQPSLLEKPETTAEQKPASSTLTEEKKPETLPVVTPEEKKKKKKKSKKSATTGTIPTETTSTLSEPKKEPSPPLNVETAPISSSSEQPFKKESSPVRSTESGANILKNIFESGGSSETSEQRGKESSSTTATTTSEQVPEERQHVGTEGNVQL